MDFAKTDRSTLLNGSTIDDQSTSDEVQDFLSKNGVSEEACRTLHGKLKQNFELI